VDVKRRQLEFLNAAAARLHADGLPFTAADPMIPNLFTAEGREATAADLPLAACWRTGEPAEAHFLWTGDDGARQVFWCAAPLPRSGAALAGIVGGVVCIMADADRLRQPTDPAWQQLAELAHDLAAPLHSLALIAEALERMPGETPELRKRLQGMQRAASRALEISSDLLRHCRGPAPASRQRDWLDLDSFLEALVEEHAAAAYGKSLNIRADLAAVQRWELFTEHILLGRLLSNLLVNAIRYTTVGGIEVAAAWRGEPGRGSLAVSVADTGQGISAEERESIFQPFTRGQAGADSSAHGSGLGLAVVERLAAELELNLEMHTSPDVGSRFTILLPNKFLRSG
jgi:signal transduction histidine kinase